MHFTVTRNVQKLWRFGLFEANLNCLPSLIYIARVFVLHLAFNTFYALIRLKLKVRRITWPERAWRVNRIDRTHHVIRYNIISIYVMCDGIIAWYEAI